MQSAPTVSIVIPCYNEQATIRLLLEAIRHQTYPTNLLEVVIADGISNDATLTEISRFQQEHPELLVKVIENHKRIIPAAINLAVRAAKSEIIIRMDAHSVPEEEYVARCVQAHIDGKGENIGGVWKIRASRNHWISRAIAAAAGHPLGVGDALYRFTREPAYVDTVPFGSYRRELFEEIGYFDETLLANEDYEFNARIRKNGGRIYLDPAIQSSYFARPNLAALARQYYRYGFWKWQMLKRYPGTLRWRQALPPMFVVGIVSLIILAPFWELARWLLLAGLGIYAATLILAAIPGAVRNADPAAVVGIPAAIVTMHFSWGSGFILSVLKSGLKKEEK